MARSFEIDLCGETATRSSQVTAAIILAAGASLRMGTPKAMVPFRGGTFLSHLCKRLAECCDQVIAVLGAQAELIARPASAKVVVNDGWFCGQLSSLQCGLRALPEGIERVVFTLVDHPDPANETLERLLRSSALIAVPVYEGRKGHPVSFGAALIVELLQLKAAATAKDVFRKHVAATEYVAVNDPGVVDDVDDAAALAAFRQRTGMA